MKKRIIPVIMLLIMTLLCGFITVLAAESKTQDGISVSIYTDKEQYKKDESIIVDIVITNMNSFDLKDVNVRKVLPEGVKLSEGIELEETMEEKQEMIDENSITYEEGIKEINKAA